MMQCAHAASPIEKALAESKIMPKGYAFRVMQNDTEAIVQAYQSPKSLTATDLKIDAVLIGKIITERLPNVAKVKVQFFKTDRSAYMQVPVTVGDITAYGLGGISKEKLLQSLEVTTVASGNLTEAERASFTQYKSDRLRLMYPSNWRPMAVSGDAYAAKWAIPGSKNWAEFFVRKQDAPSAEAQAGYDKLYGESHGYKTVRARAVAVGGQRLSGYELLSEGPDPSHPSDAPPRYDHHVYFGQPGSIYSAAITCPTSDAQTFAPTFVKILNSVELER